MSVPSIYSNFLFSLHDFYHSFNVKERESQCFSFFKVSVTILTSPSFCNQRQFSHVKHWFATKKFSSYKETFLDGSSSFEINCLWEWTQIIYFPIFISFEFTEKKIDSRKSLTVVFLFFFKFLKGEHNFLLVFYKNISQSFFSKFKL